MSAFMWGAAGFVGAYVLYRVVCTIAYFLMTTPEERELLAILHRAGVLV